MRCQSMNGLDFSCVEEEERLSLERAFSKEEVIHVLKEMEGNKALSLDGFIMAFSHKC